MRHLRPGFCYPVGVSDQSPPSRPPTPRPLADTDDTAIDDTVADRTLIVDMDRTEVDSPPRPTPMRSDEEETRLDRRPDQPMPGMQDLRRLGRVVAALLSQVGHWLSRRVLRPGIRGLEGGLKRVIELFRWRRPEDSDAYSRRRGQEWRRFREGDPGINELREFDQKHRGKRDRES